MVKRAYNSLGCYDQHLSLLFQVQAPNQLSGPVAPGIQPPSDWGEWLTRIWPDPAKIAHRPMGTHTYTDAKALFEIR